MTQTEVLARTGLSPQTVDRLRTSPARAEGPRRKTVLALAAVLAIPEDEALTLAGLAPGRERVDVRAAINAGPYTTEQKNALLGVLNVIEASNAASRDSTDRVDREA
jgi:transcriptional regulator with XRE-family HTH domain